MISTFHPPVFDSHAIFPTAADVAIGCRAGNWPGRLPNVYRRLLEL